MGSTLKCGFDEVPTWCHATRVRTRLRSLVASILVVGLPAIATADQMRGLCLYENHCLTCHESVVHIREVRKATSLEALRQAILRWSEVLNLDWSQEEVSDVLEHLNVRYYRFEGAGPDLMDGESKLCLVEQHLGE